MDVTSPMGSSDDIYVFRCDAARDGQPCDSTLGGKPHELEKAGWLRLTFGRRHHRRELLLCDACAKHFGEIWKAREAAA